MYENSDFKKGLKVMVEGNPYAILDFQHVKPGKGNQFTRTKLRNLLTGQLHDSGYTFMDQENFEQIIMMDSEIGEAKNYLTENLPVVILFYNERPVSCDVPKAVNLKVASTDPGMKGDTVSGATKPATLETGLIVKVPLHISEGDVLRIDSSSGDYVERVNK
jgi:elongation factor P